MKKKTNQANKIKVGKEKLDRGANKKYYSRQDCKITRRNRNFKKKHMKNATVEM